MELQREPFKTKDSNRMICKTSDNKKSLKVWPKGPAAEKAGLAILNPNERRAPEITHSHCQVAVTSFPPTGLSLMTTWGEELSQTMLMLDMCIEQEYAIDIFTCMMRSQSSHIFRGHDIPKSVTAEMRAVLVDWLVQVHEYLALEEETLYLAVYLMNSYLRVHKIQTSILQLLASSCLFIACKLEECLIPEPAELCFMMEDAFSKKELLKMERKVLQRLGFQLRYTQPLHFLRLLANAGKCPEKVQYQAMYFMELTLLEADGMMIEPALLALGALHLAQMVSPESRSLSHRSFHLYSYSDAELRSCQQSMVRSALRADLKSTWQKYSRPQKLGVSSEPALHSKHLIRCVGTLSTQL
ncbi:cyclin-P [Pelodytes ibericus]